MYRVKCACGEINDIPAAAPCKKCGNVLNIPAGGMLQLYRMGSPLGAAVGYGIYIDDVPFGHLANKQSIRIPLAYGTHTIHCTCGMTRRCQDLTFTISEAAPAAFVKARMKPGFWTNTIIIEPANPQEMPEM